MSDVLLIDDEPHMESLVGMSLEDIGVTVTSAATLAEAISAARASRPRVVLLDLALGTEDGLDILPKLRDEPALEGVPILAFTVHDNRRDEALARGVDGFVRKPFKAAELRASVKAHLT
ncbi:MAG: response regulator transcription factor [Actinomycetota bacterium]